MAVARAGGFDPKRRKKGISPLVVLATTFSLLVAVGVFTVTVKARPQPQASEQTVMPTPETSSVEMVDCLVAIEKIEAGSPLDATKFRKETRAISSNAANLVRGFESIRGSYAASYIAAGQPLLTDYMTSKAPVNIIQANIPDGYRAVAVSVDDVSNVEGWVRAGAKVDVMLASQISGKPVITMLVQNAKVLSAGKLPGRESSSSSEQGSARGNSTTITIMVTVDEASKIQLASSSGVMSLSLRGDEDTVESSESTTVTIDNVFGISAAKSTPIAGKEGTVKIGSRTFVVIDGKLVPEDAEAAPGQASKR